MVRISGGLSVANIDQESQDAVMDAIFDKTRGKTMVAIMHGAEPFYDRFDRIVRLAPTGHRQAVVAGTEPS